MGIFCGICDWLICDDLLVVEFVEVGVDGDGVWCVIGDILDFDYVDVFIGCELVVEVVDFGVGVVVGDGDFVGCVVDVVLVVDWCYCI